MTKRTREEILKEFERQKRRIDKHEEYMSKKNYEKKPRAIRKYEKYANMSNDKNKDEK